MGQGGRETAELYFFAELFYFPIQRDEMEIGCLNTVCSVLVAKGMPVGAVAKGMPVGADYA